MTLLSKTRYRLRDYFGKHPAIFMPLYGLKRWNKDRFVTKETDLVIEGYPRSANTYTYVAIREAQKSPIQIANHLHVPTQVIRGVQLQKPVLVLIRNPMDAVTSWIVYRQDLTVELVLKAWISFYKAILPYQDRIVVASFEQATEDLGSVVKAINERFATDFKLPPKNPAFDNHVFEMIKTLPTQRGIGWAKNEVPIPSNERNIAKKKAKEALMLPKYDALLAEAKELFAEYSQAVDWGTQAMTKQNNFTEELDQADSLKA